MDLERSFGTTSQSQQRLQGFPLRLQAQENDGADKLFLHGINKPGVFEKEISSLDEKDGDTVGRLLCWAALTNQHPDVIKRLHEKCGDFSATLRGYPPLVCAVINGHASAVKQILDLGAPVNAITKGRRDFGFCTALHSAVGISDAGIVNDLLEAGAKVDFADDLGKTALHHACDIAAVDVAVELLKRGADVNKGDRTLKTPVHIAVAANSYPLLTSLVRLGKKPSALAAASFVEQCRGEKGREEMFELLVEHKWGPRYRKTPGGNSPLTGTPVSAAPAASAAPADVKGDPSSSPRAPTPSSGSGLHQAAKTGDLDRLKELLSSGEDPSAQGVGGVSPLHLAARLGHVEVVQALLRAEAAPDARDKNSLTPLLTAAKAGKAAVVAALIAGGANPDLKDSKECSALGIAVQFRFHAVVQALVDGKASVNAGGEKGCTPLHVACDLGSAATVDTLLSAGALAGHCWNDALKSPLMVACGAGHLDVVNVLLPKLSKRQINMRDRVTGVEEGGVTALLFAIECSRGGMDIVQALLDNGADPNVRVSPSNVSALDHVVVCDNTRSEPTLGPRMVRALIKAGAKVDEMGSQGCTPLHQACLEGACGEVVQALLDAGADASAPCAGFMFMTPLQLAGCGGNPGALRVMIGLPECGGLDTVGAPPERATVLASAVRYGQAEGVRFLLEEGADMDLLPFEEDGITLRAKSLVHLAMAEGHGDVVRLLLQARQYRRESELLAGGV